MNNNLENREKEIFDEVQKKASKLVKKVLLLIFSMIGFLFAFLGIFILLSQDGIYREAGIAFLPMGLVFIALGILLYFVIPTKYNYAKYKTRVQKYGYIDIYSLTAKVCELEARVEELERKTQEK